MAENPAGPQTHGYASCAPMTTMWLLYNRCLAHPRFGLRATLAGSSAHWYGRLGIRLRNFTRGYQKKVVGCGWTRCPQNWCLNRAARFGPFLRLLIANSYNHILHRHQLLVQKNKNKKKRKLLGVRSEAQKSPMRVAIFQYNAREGISMVWTRCARCAMRGSADEACPKCIWRSRANHSLNSLSHVLLLHTHCHRCLSVKTQVRK